VTTAPPRPCDDPYVLLASIFERFGYVQDSLDVLAARFQRFDSRVIALLNRLETSMAAVDAKLDDLFAAVGEAVTELDTLRTELADAAQPGDLSPEQAARFDTIVSGLRQATGATEPAPVEPPAEPTA
jgi:hypothetical protein